MDWHVDDVASRIRLDLNSPEFQDVLFRLSMIPQHIQPFFWDIDPKTFNPTDYPDYTILRILELGDDAAVEWLRHTFSEDAIKSVLCSDRRLSRRSATFWALAYHVPLHEVASLVSKT